MKKKHHYGINKKLKELSSENIVIIQEVVDESKFNKVSYLKGITTEVSKTIFTDQGYEGFDTEFGDIVVREKIERQLLRILINFRKNRYLIDQNIITKVFKKLDVVKDDYFLFGIGLRKDLKDIAEGIGYNIFSIPNSDSVVKDTILIIHRDDVPVLKINDISADEKTLYGEGALVDSDDKNNI